MRILDGEQVLVRIFTAESDNWHHEPLHSGLLEQLPKGGFAGATVFRDTATSSTAFRVDLKHG